MIIPFQRRQKVPDNDITDSREPLAELPDNELAGLLAYRAEPPANDFVAGVMKQAGRECRTRKMVLWGTGLAGAACGVVGASLLSGPISRGVTAALESPASGATALLALGAGILVAWFLAEDQSIFG
jgi:hypothetical protein